MKFFKSSALLIAIGGFVAGFVNGLLGAGGGIIIVFVLSGLIKEDVSARDIFANALCITLPVSFLSSAIYISNGNTNFNGFLPFVIPAITGGLNPIKISLPSFIISILSGMGVGGGGLFVIYLALFTNTPQLEIQGINLVFFLFSASASLLIHLRKRKIFVTAVLVASLFGIIGALIGSIVSNKIDQALLRKIFGAMLCLSGAFSLAKSFKKQKTTL